ncbi:hypothetical protein [Streptomyces humicola]
MSFGRRQVVYRLAQATTAVAVSALTAGCGGALSRRPTAAPSAEAPVRGKTGPRPMGVPRDQWQAGPAPRHLPPAHYAPTVQAVIIHQSESGNDYRWRDVPEIIGNIYSDHVYRRGWDDIGYNFLVDKEGTLYEGRRGGIDRPVIGAHTSGFNIATVGIAAIGTYRAGAAVPEPMLNGDRPPRQSGPHLHRCRQPLPQGRPRERRRDLGLPRRRLHRLPRPGAVRAAPAHPCDGSPPPGPHPFGGCRNPHLLRCGVLPAVRASLPACFTAFFKKARVAPFRFGLHSPMTSPVPTPRAANRFVVTCRT